MSIIFLLLFVLFISVIANLLADIAEKSLVAIRHLRSTFRIDCISLSCSTPGYCNPRIVFHNTSKVLKRNHIF